MRVGYNGPADVSATFATAASFTAAQNFSEPAVSDRSGMSQLQCAVYSLVC